MKVIVIGLTPNANKFLHRNHKKLQASIEKILTEAILSPEYYNPLGGVNENDFAVNVDVLSDRRKRQCVSV